MLRAERNGSQAELAERLDVSRQSVNAIETGKFDPSLPLAFRLARLFDMPIEQIFSDSQQSLPRAATLIRDWRGRCVCYMSQSL